MNNPYWLVRIFKRDPTQTWKSHNNFTVTGFVFSNLFMDLSDSMYNSNGIIGSNAYYNIGLQVSPFKRQFSGNLFDSCVEDISQLSFTISKQWNDRTGAIRTNDFIELIRASSGSNFSLDGAGIEAWICNGGIPGWQNVGSSSWDEIAGPGSKTYTPPVYTISDSVSKVFYGTINSMQRSKSDWSFSCESIANVTDLIIGETIRGGENSTAEIKPICFGSVTGQFGDIESGFPCAQTEERTGILKLCVSANPKNRGNVNVFRLMYRDSNTDYLTRVISEFRQLNQDITLSEETASTLLANRGSGQEDWRLSQAEINSLRGSFLSPDYNTQLKQIIHQANEEQVSLPTLSPMGASSTPATSSTAITFDQKSTFDSRGWNDTRLNNHLSGEIYNQEASESVGVRILSEISLPVSELVEIHRTNSGLNISDGDLFRGATGSLWKVLKKTIEGFNFTSLSLDSLIFSHRGYGPATWNGSATNAGRGIPFYSSSPKIDLFRYIMRSMKPNIDVDDEITKIQARISAEIKISNANGTPSANVGVSTYPNISNQDTYAPMLSSFVDASTNGSYVTIAPSTGLSRQFFDDIFDKNALSLDVSIKSAFEAAYPTITYRHAMLYIHRLALIYTYKTDTKSKKFMWQGVGILDHEGNTKVAQNNIKSLVEMYTQNSVDVSLVANSHDHTGWFSSAITMRDAIKQICYNHGLLLRSYNDGFQVVEYTRSAFYKVVSEDDIYLDDDSLPEIEVGDNDLQDLYSEIVVKFRERADDGEFSSEIALNPEGWKDSETPGYTTSFDSDKWFFLTSSELLNLRSLCSAANVNLNMTSGYRRLEVNARHIRSQEEAEKLLARLVLLNCVKRKNVTIFGPLENWINTNIGNQLEFSLSADQTDSFIYQHRYGGFPRRFIISSIEINPEGRDAGVKIEAQELPYIPILDLL